MDADLIKLVHTHLLANLDPQAGLYEVIISSLPDELTDDQIEECREILAVMLAAVRRIVQGIGPSRGNRFN